MQFKDYYKILGIEPSADSKAIKTAYRKLARKFHPDVSEDKDAEEKFKEVAEAYAALKDADKRAEYDEIRQYGQHGQQFKPPPDWQSANGSFNQSGAQFADSDMSDFFESLFGQARRQQKPAYENNFAQRGQDLEIEMPIFLEDTLRNDTKTVNYAMPHYDSHGRPLAPIKKSLKVKIPKGVEDNARIRVKGQGAPGIGDAPSGDLYLHIRLVPHPLFDVEGHNLHITVPISPWEAALGTKAMIPTLSGKISLTIPKNSQSGQRLRIKGRGLPGKNIQGDLFANLNVVMPDKEQQDNTEINELWKSLSEKVDFKPRSQWSN